MTNCKLVICCITSALLLIGCNNILEPVSLFASKQDITTRAGQEEFEINIKSLTFETAKKANTKLKHTLSHFDRHALHSKKLTLISIKTMEQFWL